MRQEFTDRFPAYTNKISAYSPPAGAYPGSPSNTMTTEPLPAGKYMIGYSFEADFGGNKDKALLFKITGDFAGQEFAESASAASAHGLRSRFYMFPKDITEGTIINHGITFQDESGVGILIDFCDVILWRM